MKKIFLDYLPWSLAVWFLVGLFGFLLSNHVVMPWMAGSFKTLSEVPQLVGLQADEVETLLQDKGLGVRWKPEGKYSAIQPRGAVLIQVPPAGRMVKNGRTITLTVSKGKRELSIPSLRGKSLRQAEITLNRLGLVQGETVKGSHKSIPRGVVIRTDPPAGDTIRVGDKVDIIISAGRKAGSLLVPHLVGLSLEAGTKIVDSLGFVLGDVNRIVDSTQLPNTILTQHPKNDEYLPTGTKIRVVISN